MKLEFVSLAVFCLAFAASITTAQDLNAAFTPGGVDATGVQSQNPNPSGLWQRFQNFYRSVWRPFVSERLMRLRPQPQSQQQVARRSFDEDEAASGENLVAERGGERSIFAGDGDGDEQQRELKFKKINTPATRYSENASEFCTAVKASNFGPFFIDYRCDNGRVWLSAHNCQVPTLTSQNLELEQQNLDFSC
jgi:hypothetical protein